METAVDSVVAPKPKRQARKATSRQVEQKTKTAVTLNTSTFQRLAVAAIMTNRSQSDLVEELLRNHLQKWVVSLRGTSDTTEDRQEGMAA